MHVQLAQGSLVFHVGTRFGTREAGRVCETVVALAPVTQLTLAFTGVRESHDSMVPTLAKALRKQRRAKVVLAGLTVRQSRMLRYFGVP